LRLPRRLEALHLPFSPPSWSMRVLRSIVQVAALAVFDIGHQRALRRSGIAAMLHQDVEHDPILIDGTPKIMQLTPDPDEDLVHVPFVAWPRPTPAELVREARGELQTPSPNALIGDNHAAFGQDQLDVTKTQAEYVVELDGVAD
jgi:hypothetical protein